jgi:hypothetical protein
MFPFWEQVAIVDQRPVLIPGLSHLVEDLVDDLVGPADPFAFQARGDVPSRVAQNVEDCVQGRGVPEAAICMSPRVGRGYSAARAGSVSVSSG